MISVNQKGDFSKAFKYLKQAQNVFGKMSLDEYCRQGIKALAEATPVDSGLTAESWSYNIEKDRGNITVSFHNSNIQNGVPIAIILQYGHGTRNGGWVEGRDYINPAIQPIFDKIAEKAWREVTNI